MLDSRRKFSAIDRSHESRDCSTVCIRLRISLSIKRVQSERVKIAMNGCDRSGRDVGGCGFAEEYLYLCKQPGKVDRFGFIVVASRLQALLPVLDHRMSCERDDWDGASLRQRFELA